MCRILLIFMLLNISLNLNAQLAVHFKNPSFEGMPGPSKRFISGWKDCGHNEFPAESAPDLQPGSFEVTLAPFDGNVYLGTATRANGSYESVCQKLDTILIQDSLYQFSIYLAKSNKHASAIIVTDPDTGEPMNENKELMPYAKYSNNTVLRVWGGAAICSKEELLYLSDEIDHDDWKEYVIEFVPTSSSIQFISLETYFPDDSNFTRGNLMMDNITTVKSPE